VQSVKLESKLLFFPKKPSALSKMLSLTQNTPMLLLFFILSMKLRAVESPFWSAEESLFHQVHNRLLLLRHFSEGDFAEKFSGFLMVDIVFDFNCVLCACVDKNHELYCTDICRG